MTEQLVVYARLDLSLRFRQHDRTVAVEEFNADTHRWDVVAHYKTRATTPGGLMRSASRWLAFNRWEQLELPMPPEGAQECQVG